MHDNSLLVSVNDVDVGTIPAEKFNQIVRKVKGEKGYKARECLTLIAFLLRAVSRAASVFMTAVMVFAVILLIISVSYTPVTLPSLVEFIRTAPPEAVGSMIRLYLAVCSLCALISIPILTGGHYISAADRAINREIRQVLSVPAEGRVCVYTTKATERKKRGNVVYLT